MNQPHYAILVDGQVIPYENVLEWATWLEQADKKDGRRVALTTIGTTRISTVFLGLNHAFAYNDKPQWFETMCFSQDDIDGENERYETLDEARRGHDRMVAKVKEMQS